MNPALFVSALSAELAAATPLAEKLGFSPSQLWNVLVVEQLRAVLRSLARVRGRDIELLTTGRLFERVPGFEADAVDARCQALLTAVQPRLSLSETPENLPIEAFGQLYESLLAARPADGQPNLRKRTGSYYTPEALTRVVAGRAFDALEGALGNTSMRARPLSVLDPALGAGAFLLQAGRELIERAGRSATQVVQHELFGVDASPLAVAVAEASLWLLADSPELSLAAAGVHLREGDALCSISAGKGLGRRGVDFDALLPDDADSFDLVLGNPPWVAFAGRATQPLAPAMREHYRKNFRAFRGYPTLHALFVELGAGLAPRGVVALLIPSPVADLDGYRHVRSALARSHAVQEPLLELGQDAFESVTQPCFALVAAPRQIPEAKPERPFVLTERRRSAGAAATIRTPQALERLTDLPRLPPELFGEMGLQTNSAVTRQLLYRGSAPPEAFSYALLEGRNIAEYRLSAPRLFLKPDQAFLLAQRCRLRAAADYRRVKLVVRQTAAITIAAAHDGTPFRNSLLAGFELSEFPFELTLGLLNSTLYRALHLAGRRDARQGAFPQVKISHLRALPAPPASADRARISQLSRRASQAGLDAALRQALDAAVYAAFDISAAERDEIASFVRGLAPIAGLTAPLA
jgi:N-6 DNA Methylase/TaqI-like C-terminal specificity domain